jgi:hypothetical protein
MPRRPRVFIEGGIYHLHNRFAREAEMRMASENFSADFERLDPYACQVRSSVVT